MKRGKWKVVLLVLLALVCITGVELAACRYFEPALYERITAPVRRCRDAAVTLAHDTVDSVVNAWHEAAARREAERLKAQEAPEEQLASEPVVKNTAPVADPSITELVDEEGQQLLTGGSFQIVYFNQGEEPWADQPYGSDHIAGYGCGPTVMSMVVSSLTDQIVDPAQMARQAVDQGHWARRSGSHHTIVEGIAGDYGLEAASLTEHTTEALLESLLSGDLVVALMGPGHFTQRGHFILLRGVTLSGEVLVADPNSVERSLVTWDPQLILDELSTSTTNGAPLWSISTAAP